MKDFSFQRDVIERSKEVPVLVDFWAPWCGPCRILTPVLEEVSDEYGDAFDLVKVNTEEHQELAYQFGIRSIPNVKLFHDGQVIDEFMGALPKTQVLQWLSQALPTREKSGLREVLARIEHLPSADKVRILDAFVSEFPGNIEAMVLLNKHRLLAGMDIDAESLSEVSMDEEHYDLVQQILLLDDFRKMTLTNGSEVSAIMQRAQEDMKQMNWDQFAKHLTKAVMTDKSFRDELPRKLGVALFQLMGDQHPEMARARKLFNMALY